jgi:hypothetical protein
VALAAARVERARWGSALPEQRAGSIKDFCAARALEEPRESPRKAAQPGAVMVFDIAPAIGLEPVPEPATLLLAPSLTGFKLPLPLTLRDAR